MFAVSRKHFSFSTRTLKYVELEYVVFTGGQFIDTEIVPTDHCTEVKYYVPTYVNDGHILGTAAGPTYYHFTEYNNGTKKYFWGQNGSEASGGSWTSAVHVLKMNESSDYKVVLDGVVLGFGSEICSEDYLWIGKRNSSANYQGYIYYCKVTDKLEEKLVRDFIPAKDPDGTVCLYDVVSDTFFYCQGTGNLEAGPVVREVYEGDDENPYVTKFLLSKEGFDMYVDMIFDKNTGDSIEYEILSDLKIGDNFTEFPTATKQNHRFLGYSYSPAAGSPILMIGDKVNGIYTTAYAQWLQLISQTFDAGEGQFPDSSTTKTLLFAPGYAFSEYTFPANPSHSSKSFGGWFTEQAGAGTKITANSICPSTSNRYYANWIDSIRTMTYCGTYDEYSETDIELGEIISYNAESRTVTVKCNGTPLIDGFSGEVTFDFNNRIASIGSCGEWEEHGEFTVNWYVERIYEFDIWVKMVLS